MVKEIFKPSLDKLGEEEKAAISQVFDWIDDNYPDFEAQVKWNTPLYVKDGSFIVGVKPAKHHFSINPEPKGIEEFSDKIKEAGYSHEKMTYKIKYDQPFNYDLLKEIIDFNVDDKKDLDTFWR